MSHYHKETSAESIKFTMSKNKSKIEKLIKEGFDKEGSGKASEKDLKRILSLFGVYLKNQVRLLWVDLKGIDKIQRRWWLDRLWWIVLELSAVINYVFNNNINLNLNFSNM